MQGIYSNFPEALMITLDHLTKKNSVPKDLICLKELYRKWGPSKGGDPSQQRDFIEEIERKSKVTYYAAVKNVGDHFYRDLLNYLLRVTSMCYQHLNFKDIEDEKYTLATFVLTKISRTVGQTEHDDIIITKLNNDQKRALAEWFVGFWHANDLKDFRELLRLTLDALTEKRRNYLAAHPNFKSEFLILLYGTYKWKEPPAKKYPCKETMTRLATTAQTWRNHIISSAKK